MAGTSCDPSNSVTRRVLGLRWKCFESTAKEDVQLQRLGWKPGSLAQVDATHFTLPEADRESSMRVAEDLERCYGSGPDVFPL